MSRQYILEAEALSLAYGDNEPLFSGFNIKLSANECVSLVGPSGVGKTSLLGCISGRVPPSDGKILCDVPTATIHQDLRLVLAKSVLDNVTAGALGRYGTLRTLFGFPKAEKEKAKKLLAQVGLSHKQDIPVKYLSGGERQRVAIARALMQDPKLLLADEPIAALDRDNAESVLQLIRKITVDNGLTTLYVLHDRELAEKYSDRVVALGETNPLSESIGASLPSREREKVSEPWYGSGRLVFLFALCLTIAASIGLDISARQYTGAVGSLITFLTKLFPTSFAEIQALPWETLLLSLLETIQMAFIGTTLGALIALPLSALAAKNTGPKLLREPTRFFLNLIRTIPALIWALIFVSAVGLGVLAGVLALVAYSVGYLSKFFYEAYEGVAPGPVNALDEIGAKGVQRFLFAVWPAAKPAVLSSLLFMFEYNVRSASILGVVDAGGIGFYIKEYIDFRYFPAVTASLFLILIVVILLDGLSRFVRSNLLQNT